MADKKSNYQRMLDLIEDILDDETLPIVASIAVLEEVVRQAQAAIDGMKKELAEAMSEE